MLINMKLYLLKDHRFLAVICFFILQSSISASVIKGDLQGVILEGSNDKPLVNAVVKIEELDLYDIADKNGIFFFRDIPFGQYIIEVSHIGYKTVRMNISISSEYIGGIIIHLYPVPLETTTVVITGTHIDNKFDDMNELIGVLKGKELERELGLTLAATLKNETGISLRSMGPAPARPVIRGLGSDRIQITVDNIISTDLSSTSPDHAVAVEPFTIERIEVLRGPKILLHNSTSVGGIVNVIKEEIPTEIPNKISGLAGFYGELVNRGYLGATVLKVPYKKLVFRAEATKKKTDDVSTPKGILKNSNMGSSNISTGLSFIDDWGNTGLSVSQFELDYGVPGGFVGAHPNGVDVSILKRQFSLQFNYFLPFQSFEKLELKIARDYYRHTEYERADLIGAQFTIFNYRGSLNVHNKSFFLFDNGITGVSGEFRDFNIGGFVFTAPTKSYKGSFYSYQRYALGSFNYEASFRISYDQMNPRKANPSSKESFIKQRKFFTYSLSFSLLYGLNNHFYIGGNLSRTSRVPTIEELYSEGPHLAAYSYEIGNPNLQHERGIGLELFTYYKSENLYAMFTAFKNDFSYFIIPRNSGIINSQTLLPIYQTVGVPARFIGFESHIETTIFNQFSILCSFSFTRANFINGSPIPQIPPVKVITQLKYQNDAMILGIENETASAQKRVDIFELPTAGYFVFNAFTQYSFFTGEVVHNITLNIDNIFNTEYRNHLSRIKVILPEEGRNLRVTYRIYF